MSSTHVKQKSSNKSTKKSKAELCEQLEAAHDLILELQNENLELATLIDSMSDEMDELCGNSDEIDDLFDDLFEEKRVLH
jgi:hypothetical protein